MGRPLGSKAPKLKLKPDEERRSVIILGIRYTPAEAEKIQAAIRRSRKAPSEWMRAKLLKAAGYEEEPQPDKTELLLEKFDKAVEKVKREVMG